MSFRRHLAETVQSAPLLVRALGLVWRTAPGYSAAAGILTVVAALTPAAQAWIMKLLVDQIVHALQSGHHLALDHRLIVLLGLQMGTWLVGTLSLSFTESVRELLGFKVNQHVQYLILQKSSELDLAFFENASFYDKMENARNEAAWRPGALVWALLGTGQQALTVATMMALLSRLNLWLLPLVFLTALPQVVVAARFSRRRYWMLTRRAPERRMSWYLQQLLSLREEAHEVRMFGLARPLLRRLVALFDKFFRENRALETRRQRAEVGAAVFSMAGLGGAYGLAAVQATLGRITIGDLAMYFRAAEAARSGLFSLFRQASQIYESSLFLGSLFEFLDLRPAAVAGSLSRPPKPVSIGSCASDARAPHIELRNVGFRYPDTQAWALRDISMSIEPEEWVALAGPNGAGKSTLVKLLLRLYDPTEGQILVNGTDLKELDMEQWRAMCAPLFQNYVNYQFTVLENVCPAGIEDGADRVRAQAALDAAGVTRLVGQLPLGYETVLGRFFEGGVDLSVGEWQRVALARTWYRDAPLVILDEPTSALDANAESEVLGTYRELCRNRTAILVSHRLSAARLAHRIAVLDRGSLVECGTHDQLVASDGLYARMYRLQAARYDGSVTQQMGMCTSARARV
jgi:ATP-binding cassette subfamily B protein